MKAGKIAKVLIAGFVGGGAGMVVTMVADDAITRATDGAFDWGTKQEEAGVRVMAKFDKAASKLGAAGLGLATGYIVSEATESTIDNFVALGKKLIK